MFHLQTPASISAEARRHQLDFITRLNRQQAQADPGNSEWQARIAQFETAARMQSAVPEVMDLSGESEATRRLYGLDNPVTAEYGRRCLIAQIGRAHV